jgi:hypothetical protein
MLTGNPMKMGYQLRVRVAYCKCGANAILAEQRIYLDHPRVAAWPL